MKLQRTMLTILALMLQAMSLQAGSPRERHELAPAHSYEDRVRLVGEDPQPRKAALDTTWIATWDFEGPGGVCDDTGWTTIDRRNPKVLYGEEVYWKFNDDFSGVGGVQGTGAVLTHHDLCWVEPDGYDNNWYQALRVVYVGESALSFDYLLDSEGGFDFLQVEADSGCASLDLEQTSPRERYYAGAQFRELLFSTSGFDTTGSVDSLILEDFGVPADTHCVFLSFFADGAFAPSDGLQPSTLGIALAIDNLSIEGDWPLQEDFESGVDARVEPISVWIDRPFGDWARLFPYVTDNDVCTENPTCAWLWTDHTTPTLALYEDQAFGPNGYVVQGWLDNAILSPWVSLSTTPGLIGSVISFRRFPGSFFTTTRRTQNWSVRGRKTIDNTDTPAPGDSIECISPWGHAFQHNSLSSYRWFTNVWDMTTDFDPASTHVQVRIKTEDWQQIAGASPPGLWSPAPGPYNDRVRIGRLIQTGPSFDIGIDARSQAQDAFPTQLIAGLPGEHHEPTTDRFGTTAFSRSGDISSTGGGWGWGGSTSPRLITGDSITVEVVDLLDTGGILSVVFHGSIIAGPHMGKAPPPYAVGPNGFFSVTAQISHNVNGDPIPENFFVDLDDEYFRGGDVLLYYWQATDLAGGTSSLPDGITGTPAHVAEAEALTGGLFEVSFLPTINWDPGYLARIAADPHGKLAPTFEELAASSQSTCILYNHIVNTSRRHGDGYRTSFMYTLDRLGYRGSYDVYDHQGMGNTNNQLGGRATPEQAQGYSLIIHDAGGATPGTPLLPDGIDPNAEKIDMQEFYEQYLAAGATSEVGSASLWIMGSDVVEEAPFPFFNTTMQTNLNAAGQNASISPSVQGLVSSYTFSNGAVQDFSTDRLRLAGGCPVEREYDDLAPIGSAVLTHQFETDGNVGGGAVVMASDATAQTNTILMSLVWGDLVHAEGTVTSPTASQQLAQKILQSVVPAGCVGVPTDIGTEEPSVAAPLHSALHQSHPNPFNPQTRITFDLAREGRVTLRVYDVAGRLVRTLLDEVRPAGYAHSVLWDGRDIRGNQVPSGVYFYRIQGPELQATRKMVALQ